MTDPLHQFQIHVLAPLFKIGGIQFNFTNSAVFMLAIVAIICALLYAAFANADLVPSRLQAAGEVCVPNSSRTWCFRRWERTG